MAVAINKSIELDGFGGVVVSYWKIINVNIYLSPNRVEAFLVPLLNQASDAGGKTPLHSFLRIYNLTFAQAGLNTSQTGAQMRDTILAFILANEPDFAGGTLV